MRGGKTSVHEGGTRVPLFMRWPAAKWSPHLVKEIASHIDLFPTILDLCAVNVSGLKLDGMSLKPLLQSSGSWPERTLFTHNPIDETNKYPGAVRTQRHRLVREIQGSAGGSKARANDASARPWQLYDMEADPGQEKDIAADHPDLVQKLAARYDSWFADISAEGLRRYPLSVGHAEHNPVELHAPQAFYDKPLKFASGPGFANDWLTGWTDPAAKVWFEIGVARAGRYEVALAYAATEATKVRLSTEGSDLEAALPAAPASEVTLPHRDAEAKARYRDRVWTETRLGEMELKKGSAILTLSLEGTAGIDFKHLKLTRQERD